MRYPEKLLIRLPEGTRDRIAAQQREGELLADTQRRVVLAGLEVAEAAAPARRAKTPGRRKSSGG